MQVPPVAQNQQIYVLKKRDVPISAENCRELQFGLLSPSPLLQLSSTVEQVTVLASTVHLSHKNTFCCMNCQSFVLMLIFHFFFFLNFGGGIHSVSLRKVCVPLLSNNKNHRMWPNLMSEDIIRHVESMGSKTLAVQGQVLGKPTLPIPTATDWIENSYSTFKM